VRSRFPPLEKTLGAIAAPSPFSFPIPVPIYDGYDKSKPPPMDNGEESASTSSVDAAGLNEVRSLLLRLSFRRHLRFSESWAVGSKVGRRHLWNEVCTSQTDLVRL